MRGWTPCSAYLYPTSLDGVNPTISTAYVCESYMTFGGDQRLRCLFTHKHNSPLGQLTLAGYLDKGSAASLFPRVNEDRIFNRDDLVGLIRGADVLRWIMRWVKGATLNAGIEIQQCSDLVE